MTETFGEALERMFTERGYSQRKFALEVPISQPSLSRIVRGIQLPEPELVDRMDALLEAGGALRALTGRSDAINDDDRERIRLSIERPHRVDEGTVRAFADVLAAQRRLDDTIGPRPLIAATMAHMDTVTTLIRNASGPHRDELAEVGAEWTQFAGWLHAETRQDRMAMKLLTDAETAADEINSGILAAQAQNFKGYLARQLQRPRGIVRHFLGEYNTPGVSLAQRIGASAQVAHGYARLGDRGTALRYLDNAGRLLEHAGDEPPPRTAYWLTPTFHHLNLGIAYEALGDYHDAVDHLMMGLSGLPEDQHGAEWVREYQAALDQARAKR